MLDEAAQEVSNLMRARSFELPLNKAVRINAAAESLGCTVDSLLRNAADRKRILYVALAPHSAKLCAVPSHERPRAGSYETKQPKLVALAPHYAESLSLFGNVNVEQWQATIGGGVLEGHWWRLDTAQQRTIDEIYVARGRIGARKQKSLSVEPESLPSSVRPGKGVGLTKRERQIEAIESKALSLEFNLLSIPDGGKAQLRKLCKSEHIELFGAGDDPFNDAWKQAISCAPPRLRMAKHDLFAGK